MRISSTFLQPSLEGQRIPKTAVRLDVDYHDIAKLTTQFPAAGTYPMIALSFGRMAPVNFTCPTISLDLPQISGPPHVEIWTCNQQIKTYHATDFSIAMNEEFLIGSISLDEKPDTGLDSAVYVSYRKILQRLCELGYPYLWRAWNYFPRINDEQDGLERYRRFCVGRHQALTETLSDFPSSLPAATAVGTISGPLRIIFLAGKQPAIHFGNPRQLNAFEYPRDYGPNSPSFARATWAQSEKEGLLFIAGTASIVGHASQHIGLPKEQTEETISNLRSVLEHTRNIADSNFFDTPRRAIYKVYVRNPDSLSDIRQTLRDFLLPHDQIIILQGDICRKELLVEIEGICQAS